MAAAAGAGSRGEVGRVHAVAHFVLAEAPAVTRVHLRASAQQNVRPAGQWAPIDIDSPARRGQSKALAAHRAAPVAAC